MECHFMSRKGAIAILVASLERAGRQHKETGSPSERSTLEVQISALKQLILDVRARRVDAFARPGMEILIKD
jgi:hypothetical protein